MRRVAITGIGCVSALGPTAREFRAGLAAGRCGVGPLTAFPAERVQIRIAGEVRDFRPEEHFERKRLAILDRFAQFAVVAAREAFADAGLQPGSADQAAVILGTGAGGQTSDDEAHRRLYGERAERLHPFTVPRLMASAAVSHVTADLGVRGPAFAVTSACASAAHAIGQAFWMVRQGSVEAAVTGGSEACLSFGSWKAWEAMRVMAPDACRPFSARRRGMALAEGSAILILEPLEAARARGARVYAEIVGFGMSADAGHIVEPSATGAGQALRATLADASMQPEEVGYINAHGTGTASNDVSETRAMRCVFGGHAEKLVVSSTKSMHGHALGASGVLEAAATAFALHDGVLPPTINYLGPDPDCDLDYAPNEARPIAVEAALSSSFAFGGLNAALAFRRV